MPVYNKFRLLTGACNRMLSVALLDERKFEAYKQSIRGIVDGIKLRKK